MSWIIASIPFWLLGAFFAVIGPTGIVCSLSNSFSKTDDQRSTDFYLGLFCTVLGGVVLMFAAKISS